MCVRGGVESSLEQGTILNMGCRRICTEVSKASVADMRTNTGLELSWVELGCVELGLVELVGI